jgi:uncharacterized protein (TIGR02246 family)
MSDDLTALAARVRRLEDKEAIFDLFMAYRRCLDEKDFSGYAALFAQTGEFLAQDMHAQGRTAIEELVDGMRGTLLTATVGDDIHVVANPEITVDGDRAHARSTWIYVIRAEDGGPDLCKVGHYDDELIREDGAWRFLRRAAPTDMSAT